MSFEMGPSASYVYVTEDGLNGSTREALQRTVQSMEEEFADIRVIDAVNTVIRHDGPRRDVMDEFRQQGKYLFGTHASMGPMRGADKPFDAVLYAEASEQVISGEFSVVRLAGWMRKSVEERKFYNDRNIMQVLVDLCLDDRDRDEDGRSWGVPVGRMTRVMPFMNAGEAFRATGANAVPIATPYVYGHEKDRRALAKIDVPEDLKAILTLAMGDYHVKSLAD